MLFLYQATEYYFRKLLRSPMIYRSGIRGGSGACEREARAEGRPRDAERGPEVPCRREGEVRRHREGVH